MNWLAHILLSEYHIEFQIGNYLADPLKGKVWQSASDELRQGMKIHTIIDSYTDQHPIFKQSKQRLGHKGLLKAIVIDLTYDYLLTKNWSTYCNIELDSFLNQFYEDAYKTLPTLPAHASTPLKRMIDFDLLNKYKNLDDLYHAFLRVDNRLSARLKKRDQVVSYYESVCHEIDHIEKDFLDFFPQLCDTVRQNVNNEKLYHWKNQ